MLGKLLKYEFKSTARVFLPAYAALLVMSLVARIIYSAAAKQVNVQSSGSVAMTATIFNSVLPVAIVTTIMIMMLTAVWVVTMVVLLRRFWFNLLGREGYLSNVLPVECWEHVLCKLIASAAWYILSTVASLASLAIMLSAFISSNFPWADIVGGFSEAWGQVKAAGAQGSFFLMTVQGLLYAILGTFTFLLMVYAAMCIGQLFNKHRIWASIGSYFGLTVIHSVVASKVLTGSLFQRREFLSGAYPSNVREMLSAINAQLVLMDLFSLVICVGLFVLSSLLLKKKLNLQ